MFGKTKKFVHDFGMDINGCLHSGHNYTGMDITFCSPAPRTLFARPGVQFTSDVIRTIVVRRRHRLT